MGDVVRLFPKQDSLPVSPAEFPKPFHNIWVLVDCGKGTEEGVVLKKHENKMGLVLLLRSRREIHMMLGECKEISAHSISENLLGLRCAAPMSASHNGEMTAHITRVKISGSGENRKISVTIMPDCWSDSENELPLNRVQIIRESQ